MVSKNHQEGVRTPVSKRAKMPSIRLLLDYFVSANKERQKDLDFCLQKNLEVKAIDEVVLIGNKELCAPVHPKIKRVHSEISRPTFGQIFQAINRYLRESGNPDSVIIFANLDIFFDETLELVRNLKKDVAIALRRYELETPDDLTKTQFVMRPWSQDTWIFRGSQIRGALLLETPFTPGVLGCDELLAWRMVHSGYKVINPSLSLRSYHYHFSNYRTYVESDRIRGPSVYPPPIPWNQAFEEQDRELKESSLVLQAC